MVKFERKQLIESQVDAYLYSIKNLLYSMIIAHVLVLITALVFVVFVNYCVALVFEALLMCFTSFIYVKESNKIIKMRKGKMQVLESLSVQINEDKISFESEILNKNNGRKNAMDFAKLSRAKQLKIMVKNTDETHEVTYVDVDKYVTNFTVADVGKIVKIDGSLNEENTDIKVAKKEKNSHQKAKEKSVPVEKYFVLYNISVKDIKKVREFPTFIIIYAKGGSVIKLPVSSEKRETYDELSALTPRRYRVVC